MFSIGVHYLAVFVIALIVGKSFKNILKHLNKICFNFLFICPKGQVGNVITNRNASRVEFERLLVKFYLKEKSFSIKAKP